MACKPDGPVQRTQEIGLSHTPDNGFVFRMLQIKANQEESRLVDPGFSDSKMEQTAVLQRCFIIGSSPKLIGLEIIMEGI